MTDDLATAYGDPIVKAEMKTEDGREYPAEAYAYVPDPDKSSTWKLRLWSPKPGETETVDQIGAAVAALGRGFRGQRVQIPGADLPAVKRRVLQAWLKVHPDKTRGDAPPVLLSSRPAVRTSLDGQIDDEGHLTTKCGWGYEEKDHDYGDVAAGGDGMTHLLMAYRQMIDHPECEPLLGPLMEIIHHLQGLMTEEVEVTVEFESDTAGVDPGIFGQPAPQLDMEAGRFDKDIQYEDGQYCVFSTTGRRFGCYESEDQAKERLAQIEQFSDERVTNATTEDLVAWHDRLHAMADVTTVHVALHNLIEDALEGRGVAAPYDLGDSTDKLAMVAEMSSVDWPTEGVLPMAKRAEQRYTLGPVYVPGMEDAHGEFTDEDTLQKALWDWVRRDNRSIFLQHSEKVAGEMVEVLTWPFEVTTDLSVPGEGVTKYTFPADTPFMGVIWEDWAWELVKAGELRGYSIGGRARRMEADLPVPALID